MAFQRDLFQSFVDPLPCLFPLRVPPDIAGKQYGRIRVMCQVRQGSSRPQLYDPNTCYKAIVQYHTDIACHMTISAVPRSEAICCV